MFVINCRNVTEALSHGVSYLAEHGEIESTRNGPALVAPGPVTTVYSRPRERVLFSPVRDANPFFSLAEVVWNLGGRSDAAFLDNYVKDFGARYAEPGGIIHGAYGQRWRNHFFSVESAGYHFDQLAKCIELLRTDQGTRQAVLTMWDPEVDLGAQVLDRPCNLSIVFRVKTSRYLGRDNEEVVLDELDITVFNRSNDIIWGAYGANAVVFSFLQEYVAAKIGAEVGIYEQVSHNYHAYLSELDRLAKRAGYLEDLDEGDDTRRAAYRGLGVKLLDDPYALPPDHVAALGGPPSRLVDDAVTFDDDLSSLLTGHMDPLHAGELPKQYAPPKNEFLWDTVYRAAMSYKAHRMGLAARALILAERLGSPDWRAACVEWLKRRQNAKGPQ